MLGEVLMRREAGISVLKAGDTVGETFRGRIGRMLKVFLFGEREEPREPERPVV